MISKNRINAIGLNCGRVFAACDNLKQEMIECKAQIAFVQEPAVFTARDGQTRLAGEGSDIRAIYKNECKENVRAAIYYQGRPEMAPKIIDTLSTRDVVTAIWRMNGRQVVLISCYLHSDAEMTNSLRTLEKSLFFADKKGVIIHGDFNARSESLVKDCKTNERREVLEEWIDLNHLIVHNRDKMITFYSPTKNNVRRSSIIDYTLTTANIAHQIQRWNVDGSASASDHLIIKFQINTGNEFQEMRKVYGLDLTKHLRLKCTNCPQRHPRLTLWGSMR